MRRSHHDFTSMPDAKSSGTHLMNKIGSPSCTARSWRTLSATVLAASLGFVTTSAVGHGSAASPPSRIYIGWQSGVENPSLDAIAAAVAVGGTQPFYDWNEVVNFHPGDPDYQASIDYSLTIPDGRIASGGNDKYAGLDLVRDDWPAEPIESGPFVIEWYATTPHNPSVFRAYLTTPDWNPAQPLNWAQLEEIETGAPTLDDGTYLIPTTLPERIGRHALVVIWQRLDPVGEGFYSVSDVDFGTCDEVCECPADLDLDGTVDGADLGLLFASWNSAGGDLDGDGDTDGSDMGLLLSAWGSCGPDCDGDGIPDAEEIADGAPDCDFDGIPDECAGLPDCDGDGIPDPCAIAEGLAEDCDMNLVPDSCELAGGDANGDGTLDVCELDGFLHRWRVVDQWSGGFIAELDLVNDSGQCLKGWEVLFSPTGFEVTGSWNGRLAPTDPGQVRLVNETWNADFCSGTTLTIGMQCSGSPSEPGGFTLNGSATSPSP